MPSIQRVQMLNAFGQNFTRKVIHKNSDDLIQEARTIGAQYIELKHAGHMSHFEDPKSAIDMLLKLMN